MNTLRDTRLETPMVYTDMQGLGELREAARQQSPEARQGVARQFEALFIGMMLDSMRAATESLDSGLFGSQESDLYQQLFDRQIAQKIVEGRGLGIAAAIERQLAHMSAAQQSAVQTAPPAPGQDASVAAAESAATVVTPRIPAFAASTPSEFVAAVLPHAQRVASELGVHPLAIVAQAALETGWGRHLPRRPDGSSSFNFFGIKAGSDWAGTRVSRRTMEFSDGALRRETAQFRAYDSMAEAFADYARLLKHDPRYRAALSAGPDAARFADRLQAGGYATDPDYGDKIRAILKNPVLQQATKDAAPLYGVVGT